MARSLARTAAFLVLALVITIALSIGFSLWSNVHTFHHDEVIAPESVSLPGFLGSSWAPPVLVTRHVGTGVGVWDTEMMSVRGGTAAYADAPWNQGPLRLCLERVGFGWPLPAVAYYSVGMQGGDRDQRKSELDRIGKLQGWRAYPKYPKWIVEREQGHPHVVPTYVMPLGIAADTAMWAAALWLVVRGPGVLRRWNRRRHHWCERCGYPVGTTELCPECGSACRPRLGEAGHPSLVQG